MLSARAAMILCLSGCTAKAPFWKIVGALLGPSVREDEPAKRYPPPPRRVGRGEMSATFVGHATVLIQMDGVNILTDPFWSEVPSPIPPLGPRRIHPPGIRLEDLPPIDLILISHDHYDHLDVATLERLTAEHRPQIIAGLGVPEYLASKGIAGARGLDWWESTSSRTGLRVTSVPARHGSGRGPCDTDERLWTGFVVEGSDGSVYFAGDTGWGDHFARIGQRFRDIRLALLPIDAFDLEGEGDPHHISPSEALRAHDVLEASTSIAIHIGMYPLSKDAPHVLERRLAERKETGFWILGFGERRSVPRRSI